MQIFYFHWQDNNEQNTVGFDKQARCIIFLPPLFLYFKEALCG